MLSIYSMKKNILLTFMESLNLCLITFLLFAQETSSEDQNFLACQSRNCGNQTIKYPFYIEGVQNPSCGYPGFGISCQVDTPILQAPNNNFQIQQIFYNNQTLHLLDTAVVDLQNSCFPNINNISLNPERFQVSSTLSDLYLFSNCSTYPKNLSDYKIGCEGKGGNGNETGYVLFEGNKNLSYAMGICGKVVLAKVEVGFKSDGIVNYSVALKGGITARWIASDCSDCEGSGGRCGFDERSYHFQCFCSDRPHKVRCNKAGKFLFSLF